MCNTSGSFEISQYELLLCIKVVSIQILNYSTKCNLCLQCPLLNRSQPIYDKKKQIKRYLGVITDKNYKLTEYAG